MCISLILYICIDISLANSRTFIEECIVTSKLDHPNVLSLLGVSINLENVLLLMIMPFMHHGDVKSFLKSKRGDMIEFDHFPKVYIITASYVYTASYLRMHRCYCVLQSHSCTCILKLIKLLLLLNQLSASHRPLLTWFLEFDLCCDVYVCVCVCACVCVCV